MQLGLLAWGGSGRLNGAVINPVNGLVPLHSSPRLLERVASLCLPPPKQTPRGPLGSLRLFYMKESRHKDGKKRKSIRTVRG